MKKLIKFIPALLAAAILPVQKIQADEPSQESPSPFVKFLEQDYLLGDWGGWRTDLSNRGVDFEFFYLASVANNIDGGIKSGSVYQGALLMDLSLDSQKLLGYEGGTFNVSGLWLNGQKPFSDDYVGDLNKVNLVDFPNSLRLWEIWYEQKFLDDKLSVKFGEMSIDRDFIVPDYYNSLASINFINQTFFYPTMAFDVYDVAGLPPQRHGLASTPYSSPGIRVRWDFAPQFYVQAGIYGGNPDQTSSGTRFNLSQREGALSYYELGYLSHHDTNDPALGGSYKLGGWFHTGDFDDMQSGVTSAALAAGGLLGYPVKTHQFNYGIYFLAEQQLYLENGKADPAQQGLVGFFRAAFAPADRNLADYGVDGGLVYKGLIPTRDWDTINLGFSYLHISDNVRRGQNDVNAFALANHVPMPFSRKADYEAVIEMTYKAQLAAWWTFEPSVQRVFHPGGRIGADTADAWVVILQTTLRF
ncbi:MAG TPA: carbohydrate porin [Verrucomicrobiae bacterium]|nr:carbohydrate porin [Verrucomicrobiae bacterium]